MGPVKLGERESMSTKHMSNRGKIRIHVYSNIHNYVTHSPPALGELIVELFEDFRRLIHLMRR